VCFVASLVAGTQIGGPAGGGADLARCDRAPVQLGRLPPSAPPPAPGFGSRPPCHRQRSGRRQREPPSRGRRQRGNERQAPGQDDPAEPSRYPAMPVGRPHHMATERQHRNPEAAQRLPERHRTLGLGECGRLVKGKAFHQPSAHTCDRFSRRRRGTTTMWTAPKVTAIHPAIVGQAGSATGRLAPLSARRRGWATWCVRSPSAGPRVGVIGSGGVGLLWDGVLREG